MDSLNAQFYYHSSLDSTNAEAKRLVQKGLVSHSDSSEWSVIMSESQSAGRGRHGKEWISPAGNLYMSILIPICMPSFRATEMSYVSALALTDVLKEALSGDVPICLKWPNDVLLNNRKVAGILIESVGSTPEGVVEWLVIGIGVNVASAPDGILEYDATCLREYDSKLRTPQQLKEAILAALWRRYQAWKADGFEPVREAWIAMAQGLGSDVKVKQFNRYYNGLFKGVNSKGEIVLLLKDGTLMTFSSAELLTSDANVHALQEA